MNIPDITIKHIKQTLLRQVGDTRRCPCCGETYIPEDTTAREAMQMYRAIEQLEGQLEIPLDEEYHDDAQRDEDMDYG